MLRSFVTAILSLTALLTASALPTPARADGIPGLPIAMLQTQAGHVERSQISTLLGDWKKAWSREGARTQFSGLEELYTGGAALRTLALSNGFKGWQIDWMQIDWIQVTGQQAASTSSVLLAGIGGKRVMHVWRREAAGWRIVNELVLTPTPTM